MKTTPDLASLSRAELVALVQDLQQRLAEREEQIKELKTLLEEKMAAQSAPTTVTPGIEERPAPGSQEDLLTQLEKIYPGS
jgi:hypothetical protein